jgi:16S rRNA processing protein RimM
MIKEQLIKIGRFGKTYGSQGELTIHTLFDAETIASSPFLVCVIDGIAVPFFILNVRKKNHSSVIVCLDNVDTEKKALRLSEKDCLAPDTAPFINPENVSAPDTALVNYTVTSQYNETIGAVKHIDNSTVNSLLVVETVDGKEALIPTALINNIIHNNKTIFVNLPEGLLQL